MELEERPTDDIKDCQPAHQHLHLHLGCAHLGCNQLQLLARLHYSLLPPSPHCHSVLKVFINSPPVLFGCDSEANPMHSVVKEKHIVRD